MSYFIYVEGRATGIPYPSRRSAKAAVRWLRKNWPYAAYRIRAAGKKEEEDHD